MQKTIPIAFIGVMVEPKISADAINTITTLKEPIASTYPGFGAEPIAEIEK
jgi:hypothetical protein